MRDERIWGHQVGGRDGFTSLDDAARGPLAASFAVVLYEPAADALDEMQQMSRSRLSQTVVLPYALSNRSGRATLKLTYCPYCSSLHEPLREAHNLDLTGYDYPLEEVHEVIARREIDVYRLDELPEIASGQAGAPDLLFIDTQGSEYEILEGAGDLLDGVVAVVAEVSYGQLYEGERLFGAFVALLQARGLQFAASLQDMPVQPYRVPIGLRGNDWRIQTDGLFLRRIEDVESDPVALRKLCFAAHYFSQNAYGFECLRRYVDRYGYDFGDTTYGKFLERLVDAVSKTPAIRTASFAELFSLEESYGRCDPARRETTREAVRAKAHHFARTALDTSPITALLNGELTQVELTFRTHGLAAQADVLKRQRQAGAARYLTALGVTINAAPAG